MEDMTTQKLYIVVDEKNDWEGETFGWAFEQTEAALESAARLETSIDEDVYKDNLTVHTHISEEMLRGVAMFSDNGYMPRIQRLAPDADAALVALAYDYLVDDGGVYKGKFHTTMSGSFDLNSYVIPD